MLQVALGRRQLAISYPEQLATLFDFTDGRALSERHQNQNKASKENGFEFGQLGMRFYAKKVAKISV